MKKVRNILISLILVIGLAGCTSINVVTGVNPEKNEQTTPQEKETTQSDTETTQQETTVSQPVETTAPEVTSDTNIKEILLVCPEEVKTLIPASIVQVFCEEQSFLLDGEPVEHVSDLKNYRKPARQGDDYEYYDDFYVVDLDQDGTYEFVLITSSHPIYIFRADSDIVRAYSYSLRGMCQIFENGYYISSGGASHSDLYRATFEDGKMVREMVAGVEFTFGEPLYYLGNYYVSENPESLRITREEFKERFPFFNEESVPKYSFCEENLK